MAGKKKFSGVGVESFFLLVILLLVTIGVFSILLPRSETEEIAQRKAARRAGESIETAPEFPEDIVKKVTEEVAEEVPKVELELSKETTEGTTEMDTEKINEGFTEEAAEKSTEDDTEKIESGILVDDFDKGLTKGIFSDRVTSIEGAFQGTFAKRPSWCIITKSSEEKIGDYGLGLVIEFDDKGAGWCGWYTLLNGIDVTPYNALSFWVKGAEGREKFDIGFEDQQMQDLEIDAVYAGQVDAFLQKGVTKEWQEVRVPIANVGTNIDLSSMGSLVFWFRYGGRGKIYVDEVKFINDPDIDKIIDYNLPRALCNLEIPRSLWVWKIDPVINLKQRNELFKFCERTNITIIYLYFGASPEEESSEYKTKLAEFLSECHNRGIKIEALTGNPVWSLKEYHNVALNWIKGFLEFNKSKPEVERIDGISLDVEPYLTQEWDLKKEMIKKDYLEFLKECRELIDSYKQKFVFGMAIPIFYNREDDGEFERKIFEYVDYVALMDYYDTTEEINEGARFHIDLANKMDKKVTIGFETQNLVEMKQGKPRNTFYEEGWEEMERVLGEVAKTYKSEPSFGGFAIHCYYSYRLLTRGRNVPIKERPKDIYTIYSHNRGAKEIKIDGNLSDWDLTTPYVIEYKDNVVYGKGAWFGSKDLSAKFYSMWDKDALYFVFDITDESLVQEKRGANMWEGDHIELWIDADLMGDYNEAINSNDDFQFGFSPGNFKNLEPEVIIWTPRVKDELKNTVQIGSKKTVYGYIVEVRIPKDVIFMEGELTLGLHNGLRLGISIEPSDADNERVPQESLMSSSVNRVWGDPTTFGFLELK